MEAFCGLGAFVLWFLRIFVFFVLLFLIKHHCVVKKLLHSDLFLGKSPAPARLIQMVVFRHLEKFIVSSRREEEDNSKQDWYHFP